MCFLRFCFLICLHFPFIIKRQFCSGHNFGLTALSFQAFRPCPILSHLHQFSRRSLAHNKLPFFFFLMMMMLLMCMGVGRERLYIRVRAQVPSQACGGRRTTWQDQLSSLTPTEVPEVRLRFPGLGRIGIYPLVHLLAHSLCLSHYFHSSLYPQIL